MTVLRRGAKVRGKSGGLDAGVRVCVVTVGCMLTRFVGEAPMGLSRARTNAAWLACMHDSRDGTQLPGGLALKWLPCSSVAWRCAPWEYRQIWCCNG